MSIYLDKLAHIINCRYFIAQICTHILGAPYIDDVMSYNLLTTMHKRRNKHLFYSALELKMLEDWLYGKHLRINLQCLTHPGPAQDTDQPHQDWSWKILGQIQKLDWLDLQDT